MRIATFLLAALLLSSTLARLPTAKLTFDPSQQVLPLLEQSLKSLRSQWINMDKYRIWYAYLASDFTDARVNLNSTNHTMTLKFDKNYFQVYTAKLSGSYTGTQLFVDNVLLSYDNNGTFGLRVEDMTFRTTQAMGAGVQDALDELKPSLNKYLAKVNNWSKLAQTVSFYMPHYDMHVNMTNKMTVGSHLIDMDLDTQLCHSYSAFSDCPLPAQQTFTPASQNNSLQISEAMLNGYLSSAYKNGAFKIAISSKAISHWKRWLNLDIADLDVGLMKALVPEMDNDLDDNTLVDMELSAVEVPVLSLKENKAHLTVRLSAAFSYQKSLLGKMMVDGVFSSSLLYNSASTSLDMTNLEVTFTSMSLFDEDQKLVQSGNAYALSALAQLAQPALTKMANLKGLNLNQFVPTVDQLTTTIEDVIIEKGQMTVLIKMAIQNSLWSTLKASIEDNQL